MDTPDSSLSGEEKSSQARTSAWAGNAGYQYTPKSGGMRRRFARTDIRTERPPLKVAAPKPLEIDVSDPRAIALKRGLKGDAEKKTCVVEIGRKPYVVKGGGGVNAEHVAATECIGRLGLTGVRAPACRVLTDQECTDLAKALQGGNPDAQELATALAKFGGQISEAADGAALDKVFPPSHAKKAAELAQKVRDEALAEPSQDAAWAKVYQALLDQSKGTTVFMKNSPAPQWLDAVDGKSRADAIRWLRENCARPAQLSLIEVLGEVDRDQLQQGKDDARKAEDERQNQQAALEFFAKSPQGIQAFAGVAVADLLVGMDDRILSKWNGGNFLYDAAKGELCCVDNSKEPELGLGNNDPARWQRFLAGNLGQAATLEDMIFDRIYKKDDSLPKERPGNHDHPLEGDAEVGAAKDTIRNVLAQAVAKVDASFPQAAQDRAAFLRSRMAIDEVFRVPARHAEPPKPPQKAGTMQKLGREVFAQKKDKRGATQLIKDGLRDGTITADQARTRLQALQKQTKGLDADRRSSKISYLASAIEFAEWLEAGATELKSILAAAPAGLWSAEVANTAGAALRVAYAKWELALAKDKILPRLKAAWGAFPDAVRIAT